MPLYFTDTHGSSGCTLQNCISRSVTHWSLDSIQHKERLAALVQMFIDTCDPVTRVENPSFRAMMAKMDPKFKMPAVKLMAETAVKNTTTDDYDKQLSDDIEDSDGEMEQEGNVEEESFEPPETVLYRKMKCMAHSLQPVIKRA
ncbi:hypothetical protein Btru_077111 [Bulinus truncatus]|nr:hypothetical protein Btru_077111 [Bulinus truncatus]